MRHLNLEELSLYIDGEIDEEKKREIEGHLAVCEKCKNKVNLLKEIDKAIIEGSPQWVEENFLNSLELKERKGVGFGISIKKLALGFLALTILTLPVLGILRTSYEERVNKEFQVLIEEHNAMGIEEVIPIKW